MSFMSSDVLLLRDLSKLMTEQRIEKDLKQCEEVLTPQYVSYHQITPTHHGDDTKLTISVLIMDPHYGSHDKLDI